MRGTRAFIARAVRATGVLVRDHRIPRPLRWLAGLALLPIPGPFDEAVLLLIAPVLLAFYRAPMREAWARAGAPQVGPPAADAGAATREGGAGPRRGPAAR